MIDARRLIAALDAIVGHLTRLRRPVVSLLQPGLSAADVAKIEAQLPFKLTEELRVLYGWRNGTLVKPGDQLSDLWFFPGFYLPSLEDARQQFEDRKLAKQWRRGWFPFFEDDANDYYIVPCTRKAADTAPVIGFIHGEPEQPVEYLSITAMMETFVECFAKGIFFLDANGTLEMDDDAHRQVARRHNPGVTEWQS